MAEDAIKHDDQIKIIAKSGLVLNACGADDDAPCTANSVHYVSASNSDGAMNNANNNQWTIQKYAS